MSIFKSNAKETADRLQKVLIADKHFNPEFLKKVMVSDLFMLINNYAEIKPENLNFSIEINKEGDYIFKFDAKCERLKIFGSLPD